VPEGVLAAADIAMYDAKAAGGDGWAFYTEARVSATPRRASAAHSPAVVVT
jgi:hypothetical protein